MAPASTFEVGARVYMLRLAAEFFENGCVNIDLSTRDGEEEFIRRSGRTRRVIEAEGAKIRSTGTIPSEYGIEQRKAAGTDVSLFTKYQGKDWHNIDPTTQWEIDDEDKRAATMVEWKNNSCAEDSVIISAILLDVGRLWVDQIPFHRWQHLNGSAQLLRLFTTYPLGVMDLSQRNELRDIFVDGLRRERPHEFGKGQFHSIASVIDCAFWDLPQVSFTWSRAVICCDGKLQLPPDGERFQTYRRPKIEIPGKVGPESLQEKVNNYLMMSNGTTGDRNCTAGSKCTKIATRLHHVILDRMPYRLIVVMDTPFTKKQAEKDGYLDMDGTFKVKYWSLKGQRTQNYRLIGTVFLSHGHFTVKWKFFAADGTFTFRDFDGAGGNSSSNKRITKAKSWWDTKRTDDGGIVCFFEQVNS